MAWLKDDPEAETERRRRAEDAEDTARDEHRKANGSANRAAMPPPPDAPKHVGLELIRFDDMRAQLADGYLIKGLLGSGAMAVLYGESGTGKTFLALDLALSVAAGTEFFGHRVRRAGVVYIAAEAGRSIENRVAAAKHEIEFPEMMPFAAIEAPIDLCADKVDIEKLIAAVQGADLGMLVELIVVDTLSRVMAGGNENQPDDMGAFVRNIDRLRVETGAAVLVVHHSGKELSRGARGHSLLRAATDTEIEVTRDEATKIAAARVTKQREFATEGSLSFTLRAVELGTDCDGDPITSCIVESSEASPSHSRRLSGQNATALQLLQNALADAGEAPPDRKHYPGARSIVPLPLWRSYCLKGGLSEGDNDEAFKKAWNRVRNKLLSDGFIGIWNKLVWIVEPEGDKGT